MASEVHIAPRPDAWLPESGTPDDVVTAWRAVLGAVEQLVDAVSAHQPGPVGCVGCGARRLPCGVHESAVGELLAALDDLAPRHVRLDAPPAADVVPGSPFVELGAGVLVDPTEVAAITQDPGSPDRTRVWIRADRPTAIPVDRPLVELAAVLTDARASAGP